MYFISVSDCLCFFFFKQKTAYEMRISDWSSDVCSSDLLVTDIALQPGENLVAVASGDTARWVIGDTTSGSGEGKQTHVLAKPFSAGLLTNLVITTDRRAYHIRLVSTSGTALSSMRWTYPQDELLALRRKAEVAQDRKSTRLNSSH